jgi:hypothetical protein
MRRSALWAALELFVPSEVAELSVASSDDSLTVHDHVAFETLPDRPWVPSNPVRGAGGDRYPHPRPCLGGACERSIIGLPKEAGSASKGAVSRPLMSLFI